MFDIYQRVANWNAQRYERQYHSGLLVNLLTEEFVNEYLASKKPVDRLDGLCDTIYVALGGIWKLNLVDEHVAISHDFSLAIIESAYKGKTVAHQQVVDNVRTCIKQLEHNTWTYAQMADILFGIVHYCMSLIESEFGEGVAGPALEIVCDSNDSKSVKKTASDVKANANDKGSKFIPPEPRLSLLLEVPNEKHS